MNMLMMGRRLRYLLRDVFATDLAVGAVNGTPAAGTPGWTRRLVDTEGKVSITGGELFQNGGKAAPGYNDPGMVLQSANTTDHARIPGKVFLAKIKLTSGRIRGPAWANGLPSAGGGYEEMFYLVVGFDMNVRAAGGASVVLSHRSIPVSTDIYYAVALRATGAFFFHCGSLIYPDWKLDFVLDVGNATPLYPGYIGYDGVHRMDNWIVPKTLWLPTPLVSDGFGAIASDGFGHPEGVAGGVGSGGSGLAWIDEVGTWENTGGTTHAVALAGGIAIRLVDTGTKDAIIEVVPTHSAGGVGIVSHYVDANNYIIHYHDGTNIKTDRVLAGVTTNIISTAKALAAGAKLSVTLDNVNIHVYYGQAANISSVHSWTSISSEFYFAAKHGLYTTDLGNTLDNFVVYAGGNRGEYSWLSTYLQIEQLPASAGSGYIADWKTALAAVTPGTSEARVVVLGDSWINNKNMTEVLRTNLQTQYGDGGPGYCPLYPANLEPLGLTLTSAGTWTFTDTDATPANTPSIDLFYAKSTDTATPATATYTAICTKVVVHYKRVATGGTFSIAIDGGAPAAVDTDGATAYMTWDSGALSNASHSVVITITDGTGAGVTIMGADLQIVNGGVRVHQMGNGGNKTSDIIAVNAANWQAGLALIDPQLVVVLFGNNEWSGNVTPSTYKTNLGTLVDWIATACPDSDIVLMSNGGNGQSAVYQETEHVRATFEAAREKLTGFFNTFTAVGDYSATYFENVSHLNDAGAALLANALYGFLTT